jgi:hypothetical protein
MYKYMPQDIDDNFLNFKVSHIMPLYKDIPAEFKDWNNQTKWNKFFNICFFVGADNIKYIPNKGIDTEKALKQIRVIMSSWEPKHEHKEAAVAYLLSLWFKDITYEPRKKSPAKLGVSPENS